MGLPFPRGSVPDRPSYGRTCRRSRRGGEPGKSGLCRGSAGAGHCPCAGTSGTGPEGEEIAVHEANAYDLDWAFEGRIDEAGYEDDEEDGRAVVADRLGHVAWRESDRESRNQEQKADHTRSKERLKE